MNKKLIKVDRNGTKYFMIDRPCERCGGAGGSDAWAYTGWTCYECGGTGQGKSEIVKEYTPEYEAKLEERRRKRREKWEAEHADEIKAREEKRRAEEETRRIQQEKEEAERKAEEERIKAEKAISQHFGSIGDKVDLKVKFHHVAWFEIKSFRGYGYDTMYIYTFKTEEGNTIIWKTTKGLGRWNDDNEWEGLEEGQEVQIKGTIKEHSEYDGEKQTVLTRCRIKY